MIEPSEKAKRIISDMQAFVRDEVIPLEKKAQLQWGEAHPRSVLADVWKRSCELGFYNVMLPEELGGAGLSVVDLCAVKEAAILTGSMLAPHVLGELSGPP